MLTCNILINIKSYTCTDTLLNMYLYGTKGIYIVENLFCQIFTNFVYFILMLDTVMIELDIVSIHFTLFLKYH